MVTKKKSRFSGKVGNDSRRQQSATSNYGYLILPRGVSVFKEKPGGKVKLDIMPYVVSTDSHPDKDEKNGIALKGELWYKRPYRIHKNIGSSNDSYVCLSSIGKKCPICEVKAKMTREGASKEETDALKSSLRNLYVVIPIGEKELEEKPYIWDISQAMFQQLLNEEIEENMDNEVFPDLEMGKTLRIRFDSKTIGKSKPFAEASRIDFEDREEAYDESILDSIPDLDKVLKILSYKELEAKFLEIEDEDVEDERPSKKKVEEDDEDEEEDSRKTNRKKKVAAPEPEDEDEEEEEEDEEEEVPQRRKRKPAPVEEDEEDDEDEEEAPKKRSKKQVEDEDEEDDEDEEAPTKKQTASGKCPHGHRFGSDCEKFDDCDTCKKWDACIGLY